EDKLLFILTYLKVNPTQEIHGQMFDMSQSNVSKWFHLLHDVLNVALKQQNFIPARTAQELANLLQSMVDKRDDDDGGSNSPAPPQVFYHDGTERPINRPSD